MNGIRLGIDKTMGNKNTTNLTLKTMKLVFQIDEDIIRQLKLFIDGFVKMIGKDAAK